MIAPTLLKAMYSKDIFVSRQSWSRGPNARGQELKKIPGQERTF